MEIIEKSYTFGKMDIRTSTKRIILHHAAAVDCTADQVHSWHKARGWAGIGYHFFITKEGKVYRGRPENTVGAHAGGSNSDSIGICFEGNYATEKTMPEAQKKAGIELLCYLREKYGISKVQGHRDVCSTACPGKYFPFDDIVNGKVEKVEPEAPPNKLYRVQVGAYSKKENAERMAAKLKADGYDVIIKET